MNKEAKEKLDLFLQNTRQMQSNFRSDLILANIMSALFYTQSNQTVSISEIQDAKNLIRQNSIFLSAVPSSPLLGAATLISLSKEKETLFRNMLDVYRRLRYASSHCDDYSLISSYYIANYTCTETYDTAISRMQLFYQFIKQEAPLNIRSDTYTYAALLAISDLDMPSCNLRMNTLYREFLNDFQSRSSILALCHILLFSNQNDFNLADWTKEYHTEFKSYGFRFRDLTILPMIGFLSILSLDIPSTVSDIMELYDCLRSQKELSRVQLSKTERLAIAIFLFFSSKVEEQPSLIMEKLNTCYDHLINAQQIAILYALSQGMSSF